MPAFEGREIIEVAMDHLGEPYVLGAVAPLANANWRGPWDCAEFVSWCAYQAYRIVYAVRPPNPVTGESFSGWWFDDANNVGVKVTVGTALATPGAILVRKPNSSPSLRIGHVAISLGDGRTVEAKDRNTDVAVVANAASRPWSVGVLLPGVQYQSAVVGTGAVQSPRGLLFLDSPFMRGPAVRTVQNALAERGFNPGSLDGVFGPLTDVAVTAFQASRGIVRDGIVGPQTARELGLDWPIAGAEEAAGGATLIATATE